MKTPYYEANATLAIRATGKTAKDARKALKLAIASAISNVEYGDQDAPEGSTATADVLP